MLGRLPSKADARDRRFMIPKPRETTRAPNTFWPDWKRFLDQGETPTCLGHAGVHFLLDGLGMTQFLNPFGLYAFAQLFDEFPDKKPYEGTSVRGVAKALQKLGLIGEYRWARQLQRLIETVRFVGPVIVGTDWYGDMMEPDRKGFLHLSGGLVGGHGYEITGVNTVDEYFRMKNTYSRKWGRLGRAYIRFRDMRKLIRDDGEILIAKKRNPLDAFPRVNLARLAA